MERENLMGNDVKKLTMDQPAFYQIKVPGILSERWSDWGDRMELTIDNTDEISPITALSGSLDQAALLGLLRQLNSLGVPLISVICIETSAEG
jgi:hypothetical protein